MCGIAGTFSPGMGLPSESLLRKMLHLIRHRGPDGFGVYRGPGIGLAHARLSIIDLATGQQPMCNEDRSLWIVFNGEIFNYVELREELRKRGHEFRTLSDTEVILHLYEDYGTDSLSLMNGQFAIAIWNARERKLFLARDRAGIRPLFYARKGENIIFASEVKAIFADPRFMPEIDPIALDDVFTFWSPLSPRTAFKEVSEIPPAHYLAIDRNGAVLKKYWELPAACDPPGDRTERYYQEELRGLLVDSTRMQLRSDVPVGAYLSGGLDSSVTASLIRNFTGSDLSTFSVRFEDPEFDEGSKQKVMAEYLRTDHRDITCRYSDIAESFKKVIWHAEVPILRTAPVPLFLLSRYVRENSFKVVLTGEGADEILAGYDLFKEAKIRRFMAASPDSRVRPLLLHRLYPYLRNSPTRSIAYAKSFFGASIHPFGEEYYSHAPRWNMTSMGKSFFSQDLKCCLSGIPSPAERIAQFFCSSSWSEKIDHMTRAQEIEFRTLLPGYILSSQGDRMLMAHSVEGRFPFLDHRVVEFCMRLPPSLRMKGLEEKYILRKSMSDLLPEEIRNMVKQPYRAPDSKSFFGKHNDAVVDELLSPSSIKKKGYFDPQQVEKLVTKCRRNPVIGFKDNMGFIGILSTQLLDELFVRDFSSCGEINASDVRVVEAKS